MGPEHAIHSQEALVFFACLFAMIMLVAAFEQRLKPQQWRILLGGLAVGTLSIALILRENPGAQRAVGALAIILGFLALVFGSRKRIK